MNDLREDRSLSKRRTLVFLGTRRQKVGLLRVSESVCQRGGKGGRTRDRNRILELRKKRKKRTSISEEEEEEEVLKVKQDLQLCITVPKRSRASSVYVAEK